MKNNYYVGWKDKNGAEIIDGPRRHEKNSYTIWKIQCPKCKNSIWTKPTFSRLKNGYICRSCYYENNKIKNDIPSKNKSFNSLKVSAKKRNLEISITFDQYLEIASKSCYYCGTPPEEKSINKSWQKKALLNGIDRVNNSLGYTKDNCVPCCTICNRSKNKYSVDEWSLWIEKVYFHFIKKE